MALKNTLSIALFALSASLAATCPSLAAEEGLGTLELADLFLEPQYSYVEGSGGAFQLGSSYFAAGWTRDRLVSAIVKVGTKRLIGSPSRYSSTPAADEISVVEGFAQLDSDLGRFRLGMIPIPFGLEGGDAERRLRLPRSLGFQSRFLNLRDIGASYRIGVNGFFSDWSVHNGEGGTDLDGEAWFTGRWGWEDARVFRIGLSGSAGRTSPKSTQVGIAAGAVESETGFKYDKSARIRVANAFMDWLLNPFRFSLEATAGDTFQGDADVMKFRALHADLDVQLSPRLGLLTRYDIMSPRNDVSNSQITESSAGLAWRSRYENSVLYLVGTKRSQQNVSQDVHRGMIIWRITPMASSFPSTL